MPEGIKHIKAGPAYQRP
jgi:hypothetical protein